MTENNFKLRPALATGFLSAVLFICGLVPDFPLHGLSLLGWLPLFWNLCKSNSLRSHLIAGITANLLISAFGLYWLTFFGPGLFTQGLLATFWVLPALMIATSLTMRLTAFKSFIPVISGLFWAILGYLLTSSSLGDPPLLGFFSFPLILLQVVPYTGYLTLTALWVIFCASLADFFATFPTMRSASQKLFLSSSLLIFSGIFIFGAATLSKPTPVASKSVQLALIQHQLAYGAHEISHFDLYEKMIKEAALEKPDMIVLPLYSFPLKQEHELLDDTGIFRRLSKELNIPILLAARFHHENLPADKKLRFSEKRSGHYSVNAFFYLPDGSLQIRKAADMSFFHDKNQDLHPEDFRVFDSPFGKFGILICYESEKPKWARLAKELGADFLIGLADPADFSRSFLPYYQLSQNRLRAIENGLYFARVTPNGFTAVIDPQGRIIRRSKLKERQILFIDLPLLD